MGRTFGLTFFFGIVFFTAERLDLGLAFPQEKWFILAFFLFMSILQHQLMAIGLRQNQERFVKFYLINTVLRLIGCVLFVGAFLYWRSPPPLPFVVTFFALYLFYTFFEVLGLYRNLRRDLKQ